MQRYAVLDTATSKHLLKVENNRPKWTETAIGFSKSYAQQQAKHLNECRGNGDRFQVIPTDHDPLASY